MNDAKVIDSQWAYKSGARWCAALVMMRHRLGLDIGNFILHADGTAEQINHDPQREIAWEDDILLELAGRLGALNGPLLDPPLETMDKLWPKGREWLDRDFRLTYFGAEVPYEQALQHFVNRVNGFQIVYHRTIYGLAKAFLHFPRYSQAALTAMVVGLERERKRVEEEWIDPVDDPIYDEEDWAE